MSLNFDKSARYAETHDWARVEGDLVVCGISDFAQVELSDVVFVELPEVGGTVAQGTVYGTVESVKAAEEVYAPVSGEIVEINEKLEDEPELINTDPYGEAWIIKVKPDNLDELDGLMDAAAYEAYIEKSQGH